jgi:hypothetical protein
MTQRPDRGQGWPVWAVRSLSTVPEVQLPQHATAAEYLAAADAVTGIRIGQRRSEA